MGLKPIEFRTGKANKMLTIFRKLYLEQDKVRHVIWVSNDKIFIQKTVSTKNVNEFILKNPNQIDKNLIEAFGKSNDSVDIFFVDSIEIDDNNDY